MGTKKYGGKKYMISKKYGGSRKSKTRRAYKNKTLYRRKQHKGGINGKTRKQVREDKEERKKRFEEAMYRMDDKSSIESRGSLFRKSIMPHMKERGKKDYKEMKQREKEKNESSSLVVNRKQDKKYVPASNIFSFAEEEEEEEEE